MSRAERVFACYLAGLLLWLAVWFLLGSSLLP